MSSLTQEAHLRLTSFFIGENPSTVELRRAEKVATGTGGSVRGAEQSVGTLRVRLVGINHANNGTLRTTADGAMVFPVRTMIAERCEDIRLHDRFTYQGRTQEVVGFADSPPWRINAEVYEHAGD